jgi:hypothetical protein
MGPRVDDLEDEVAAVEVVGAVSLVDWATVEHTNRTIAAVSRKAYRII